MPTRPPSMVLACAYLAALGCAEAPGLPPAPTPVEVVLAPQLAGQALVNTRLQVGRANLATVSELLLFEGTLTEYQLNRIVRREIPASLLARKVPLVAWFEVSAGAAVAAPWSWLEPGAVYALASANLGLLAEFRTAAGEPWPRLERIWPPQSEFGAGPVVFCGTAIPGTPVELELVPDGDTVTLAPGIGAHSSGPCVSARVEARPAERVVLFPAHASEYLLDPAPLAVALASAPEALHCDETEVQVGVGCIRAEDDRAVVRTPNAPLLWRVGEGEAAELLVSVGGSSWQLHGLTPDSEHLVRGSVHGLDGLERAFELSLRTTSPRARLALSEVLANPIGPEPAGEWVELVNDGATVAELSGLSLSDSGGSVTLPEGRLEPGAFALLVPDAYEPTPFDVPPPEGCTVVRLAKLGKSGLTNTGEPLRLVDAAGRTLSEAPPMPATPGVSVARFRASLSSGAPDVWRNHPAPGASPCAANPELLAAELAGANP